jgi:hypothetical protein
MAAFDRDGLLDGLEALGRAAAQAGTRLDLAVYGGSALMLAGNFRYATEDVDIAEIPKPWPQWLSEAVAQVAAAKGWSADWLNDAVQFHPSPAAGEADHALFGSFPRAGDSVGLRVFVPSADYMLALKLKAMRVNDPLRGPQEASDVMHLIRVCKIEDIDGAMAVLARYFPRSADDGAKQRFLLKHIWSKGEVDAPRYPERGD